MFRDHVCVLGGETPVENKPGHSGHKGERDILDVVVDDAALVEELNTGEERTEPFFGMRLRHFNSDEPRMVRPVEMKKIRVSRIL